MTDSWPRIPQGLPQQWRWLPDSTFPTKTGMRKIKSPTYKFTNLLSDIQLRSTGMDVQNVEDNSLVFSLKLPELANYVPCVSFRISTGSCFSYRSSNFPKTCGAPFHQWIIDESVMLHYIDGKCSSSPSPPRPLILSSTNVSFIPELSLRRGRRL